MLCNLICNKNKNTNNNKYIILDTNNKSLADVLSRDGHRSSTANLLNNMNNCNINLSIFKSLQKINKLKYLYNIKCIRYNEFKNIYGIGELLS